LPRYECGKNGCRTVSKWTSQRKRRNEEGADHRGDPAGWFVFGEFLLTTGYEVHGLLRPSSTFNTERLDDICSDPHERGASLFLHYGDVTDGTGLRRTIEKVRQAEI
jgi:hypothetical protein